MAIYGHGSDNSRLIHIEERASIINHNMEDGINHNIVVDSCIDSSFIWWMIWVPSIYRSMMVHEFLNSLWGASAMHEDPLQSSRVVHVSGDRVRVRRPAYGAQYVNLSQE